MKKKILAIVLCVVMLAIAVAGGTLAYFTDADADTNVMTSGNVKIVQNETDRDGNAYEDEQPLLPAVYLKPNDEGKMVPYNPATTTEGPGGYGPQTVDGKEMWYTGTMENTNGEGTLKIYDDNINNEIDKVISITNNGTLPAYVRTILLVENDAENKIWDKIHVLWCNNDGQYRKWVVDENGKDVLVTIEGVTYSVAVCTYNTELAAGKTTSPSMMQLFLDPSTNNDWYDLLGDDHKLTIIALSQAAQTTGFENAAQALDTAFGEVNAENVLDWVKETGVETTGEDNKISAPAA